MNIEKMVFMAYASITVINYLVYMLLARRAEVSVS